MNLLEYFDRDDGPQGPPQCASTTLRALLACLALIAFEDGRAQAQTLTPDLFRPVPGASSRRRICHWQDSGTTPASTPATAPLIQPMTTAFAARTPARRRGSVKFRPMPCRCQRRIGLRFDSLNRKRKKPKFYPARPNRSAAGPRQPAAGRIQIAAAVVDPAVRIRQQDAAAAGDGGHGSRPSRSASASRSMTIRSARSAITPAAF